MSVSKTRYEDCNSMISMIFRSTGGGTGRDTGGAGETTTVATTTTLDPASHALKCTAPDHYCNPTADDLIKKVEDVPIQNVKHCHDICKEYVEQLLPRFNMDSQNHEFRFRGCAEYTFFNFRGIMTCFLLSGCHDKRPRCTQSSSCVSGSISCETEPRCPQIETMPSEQLFHT